ncbi:MAG: DUF1552 domain-containing protein [Acidobacteria bacterium]|nr:DUF1552 domain-containing protein [Acidobacteriota bacterium]
MFVTRMTLPRRTFLKGVGATVALPFLEAMVPAFPARAQAATGPLRAAFVYWSNGTIPQEWTPAATGSAFPYSTILKPLEPFRHSTVVLSGLDNTVEGTHPTASSGWLTGVSAKPTEGDDVYNNTSIDQVIAAQIGHRTLLPSIELMTEDFSSAIGSCAGGYSCIYANTISWKTPTTPLPMELNPRSAFERMFGRAGSAAQRAARLRRQSSILDSVGREIGALQGRVGPGDRRRLDEYFTNLRQVEERIQRAERQNESSVTVPDAPLGIPQTHDEHLKLMFDLIALAYQADVTRIATFYTTREISQITYPQVDVHEPHHVASHHANGPERIGMMVRIGVYYSQVMARFLEKLASMQEGDGTVLDRSMIFYGNGLSNSDQHVHLDLPMAVFGGQFKGDRHIAYGSVPMANLWMTAAATFDVPLESFGNSTGRLEI